MSILFTKLLTDGVRLALLQEAHSLFSNRSWIWLINKRIAPVDAAVIVSDSVEEQIFFSNVVLFVHGISSSDEEDEEEGCDI